jgi:hypothetical protein
MAEPLGITVAQVLPDTSGDRYNGIAGATILAGQAVYLDALTSTLKLADANVALTPAAAAAIGIALHGSLAGQPLQVQRSGDVTVGLGAAPVEGAVYVVSATPGGISLVTSLTTGWYATLLGIGIGSGKIRLSVFASGQLVPA